MKLIEKFQFFRKVDRELHIYDSLCILKILDALKKFFECLWNSLVVVSTQKFPFFQKFLEKSCCIKRGLEVLPLQAEWFGVRRPPSPTAPKKICTLNSKKEKLICSLWIWICTSTPIIHTTNNVIIFTSEYVIWKTFTHSTPPNSE